MRKHVKKMVEQTVLESVTCDLCGAVSADGRWRTGAATSYGGRARVHEVKISHEVTSESAFSDDGGEGQVANPDVCPPCMSAKVIPALEALGLKFTYTEFDW